MRYPSRREGLIFLAGVWAGMLMGGVTSAFAQGVSPVAHAAILPIDQGTPTALTKFFTDMFRRAIGGERQCPGWVPLALAAVFGPLFTALIAVAFGINLMDGATAAMVFVSGWLAATGGAVLLTAMHDQSRQPEANLPPRLADVPDAERAQLCCLHGDCRTVQMASVQAAAGQPAIPVEAAQPVPTSPPEPPPPPPITQTQPYTGLKG